MPQLQNSFTIGALCRKIRMSRELDIKDINAHFSLSKSTISRIEQNDTVGRESFQQYIRALTSNFAHPPLTSQQAEHLLQLYDMSRQQKVYELEAEVAAISLGDIKAAPSHGNKQLRELHDLFRSQSRPALLCDDLWFDHAINGALLDLFDMSPNAHYMYDWKTWHSLATKLHAQSLVLKGHDDFDHALPPTVQLFYAHSYRYLFTIQMQYLLLELNELSRRNEMQFEQCLAQVTSYAYTYSQNVLTNLPKKYIYAKSQRVYIELQIQETYSITLEGGYTVNYHLMTWNPALGHSYSEQRFKMLRESGRCQAIYYAIDYDKNNTFHINTWPAVKKELATRGF